MEERIHIWQLDAWKITYQQQLELEKRNLIFTMYAKKLF